jgi:hypothetical protein
MADELMPQLKVHEEFGFPMGSLRAWRHMGKGPKSFLLGGRVTYRRSDVEEWIRASYEATVKGDELVKS